MGFSLSERDSRGGVGEKNDIASYLWKHKEGRMGKIYREEGAVCVEIKRTLHKIQWRKKNKTLGIKRKDSKCVLKCGIL